MIFSKVNELILPPLYIKEHEGYRIEILSSLTPVNPDKEAKEGDMEYCCRVRDLDTNENLMYYPHYVPARVLLSMGDEVVGMGFEITNKGKAANGRHYEYSVIAGAPD